MTKRNRSQIIEIDPLLIRFSPHNRNRHEGPDFLALRRSIKKSDIIELPVVRLLPGGEYECISGEGRIRAAQAEKMPKIEVVSKGIVSDDDALIMLREANAVRTYEYLSDAKTIAEMHRTGMSYEAIGEKLGMSFDQVQGLGSVGHIPDEITDLIYDDIRKNGKNLKHMAWGHNTFRTLLLLRQEVPGIAINGRNYDASYIYDEVEKLVKKIIALEIRTHDQLEKYVERRRGEIFEENFNLEVNKKVEEELAKSKTILQEETEIKLRSVEDKISKSYSNQLQILQEKYNRLEDSHNKVVSQVARRPEIVERREVELKLATEEVKKEREKLEEERKKLDDAYREEKKKLEENANRLLTRSIKEQSEKVEREADRARAAMDRYLDNKEAELEKKYKIAAQSTLQSSVAHLNELLSQIRKSGLLLLTPDYARLLSLLTQAEIAAALAQIMTALQTLEQLEKAFQNAIQEKRSGVSVNIIEETVNDHKEEKK